MQLACKLTLLHAMCPAASMSRNRIEQFRPSKHLKRTFRVLLRCYLNFETRCSHVIRIATDHPYGGDLHL